MRHSSGSQVASIPQSHLTIPAARFCHVRLDPPTDHGPKAGRRPERLGQHQTLPFVSDPSELGGRSIALESEDVCRGRQVGYHSFAEGIKWSDWFVEDHCESTLDIH